VSARFPLPTFMRQFLGFSNESPVASGSEAYTVGAPR